MMRIILFILLSGLISAGTIDNKKENLAESLLGTWVHGQGGDKKVLRYVRARSFTTNKRGFEFHENGKVDIYAEFGCQLPPNFRIYSADWEVKNNHEVLIDDHYPGEKPRRMKIEKIDRRVMKFTWK